MAGVGADVLVLAGRQRLDRQARALAGLEHLGGVDDLVALRHVGAAFGVELVGVGEELGFMGIVGVLVAVFAIVLRALWIGRRALRENSSFAAFIAYGIGIWFAFQALVNIGAAAGLLPTKGLTLPLISYGGTSLLVSCVALGLLLRIDYEVRVATIKVARGVSKTASARRRRVRA